MTIRRRRICILPWYGGKTSHLAWLLPLLPKCRHYCEPFGGSAAVLLNRDPSPIETYNDIDGELVNFFRVLRDDGSKLVASIFLTPYAREEYNLACARQENISSFERARRFCVRALQCYGGIGPVATYGSWAYDVGTCRSRRVGRWQTCLDDLVRAIDRLRRVQIENRPAIDLIKKLDSPDTLFYCDPPYIHSTRVGSKNMYAYEMTDDDHKELAEILNQAKSMIAVSGYDCPLARSLYPEPKWRRVEHKSRTTFNYRGPRTEILWMNYDLKSIYDW